MRGPRQCLPLGVKPVRVSQGSGPATSWFRAGCRLWWESRSCMCVFGDACGTPSFAAGPGEALGPDSASEGSPVQGSFGPT